MDEQEQKNKDREAIDNEMITQAFNHLLETYLNSRHRKKVDIITKAFNFAKQAHKGVRRLSGEPYILHPIAVAQIACEEMGLGSTSICSALLHDVVEAKGTVLTAERLHEVLKLENGVIDTVRLPNGITVAIPGSISFDKMSEAEFVSFFAKAQEWLARTYGFVPEDQRRVA